MAIPGPSGQLLTGASGPQRDLPEVVHGARVRVRGVARVARAQRHARQVAQLLVQAQPHDADWLWPNITLLGSRPPNYQTSYK